jgi:uncharacterized integral membrane protein (TIGR00698 family)
MSKIYKIFKKNFIPFMVLAVLVVISILLIKVFQQVTDNTHSVISPLFIAIILGLLLRNLVTLPKQFPKNSSTLAKFLLKLGIILMGIKINILVVSQLGIMALVLVILCISIAIGFVLLLQKRLNISKNLALLIAGGTSICGVSAIAAITPVIDANEEESGYAIGVITIFGILATFSYPYLTELVFNFSTSQAGFFLGTSIHDTSQVTAAALIYDQLWGNITQNGLLGSEIAVTIKLVRNSCMLVVIPLLGIISNRQIEADGKKSISFSGRYFPKFVIGFVLFAIARTFLDNIGNGYQEQLQTAYGWMKDVSFYSIAIAVAGLGVGVDLKQFKKLGFKPLLVGLLTAIIVGAVSFIMLTVFSKFFIL